MKDPSLRANARVCSPQETETPVSVTPSYLASESLHGGADRLPRPQRDERHSAVRLRRRAEHGSPEQLFVHTLDNDAFQVPAFHPSRGTDPSFADLRVSSWPLLCSSQCFISADQRFSKTCKELIKESVFARSSVSVHIILDSVVQRGSRADSGG